MMEYQECVKISITAKELIGSKMVNQIQSISGYVSTYRSGLNEFEDGGLLHPLCNEPSREKYLLRVDLVDDRFFFYFDTFDALKEGKKCLLTVSKEIKDSGVKA